MKIEQQVPRRDDYAPYHTLDAFQEGVGDYSLNKFRNPYDGFPSQGVQAQAWDRGLEYAMRYIRWCDQNDGWCASRDINERETP